MKTTKKESDRRSTKQYAALSLLENQFVFPHLNYNPYSQNSFVERLTLVEVRHKRGGREGREGTGGRGKARAGLEVKKIGK